MAYERDIVCRVATTLIEHLRFTWALVLGLAVVSTMLTPDARAQDAEIALARLRSVDTSSPRATLRSFLHHFDASVAAWRAGDETARRRSALMASASIDFSDAPPRGKYIRTFERLRYVLAELRKLLLGHPMVTEAPARVRFIDFGEHSLNVEIFAYLRCQDQNTFLAIREDVLLRVADIVKEAGTAFAVPTRTLHLGRDAGLSEERSKDAETKVEAWRKSGTLPFPEFDADVRSEIEDRLDYPPEGSSQSKPQD